jgi:hypothetical protein
MSEMDMRGESPEENDDLGAEEVSIEAPEADAAEQQRRLDEDDDDLPQSVPLEVDPADAIEQERAVGLNEDDYR